MNRLTVGGWLLFGLLQVLSAIQYTGFDSSFDPSECALVLNQHSDANLLASVFPYAAPQTCITYDAVNQAYLDARKRIPLKIPEGDYWKHDEIASVGELLLDISSQLAKNYGMSLDDIDKGLPLIDTSKTLIREVCPSYLSDVQCHAGKYRRHDGLCNNLQNPTWGAANTPFTRLMAPQFADWMSHPRQSVLGNALPLPRIVSRTIHPDEGFHDHAGTVMIVAWGQFMDHDFTLTATPLDRFTKNEPEDCCNAPPHLRNPYCMDLVIPEDDYFYNKYNVKCQSFVRSFPSPRPGCRLGARVPFNTLTGVIDGNTVYGVTEEFGRYLRSGYSGLLRMNPVFSEFGLKDLLPLKLDHPEEGCTRANSSEYCFEAGEIRVNEQLVLACMHTLMARQHNVLAKELAKINPHWDDETLFQEARRIVIAQIQHITFNEFLPIILGKEVMEKFGLVTEKEGYWDGYDPNINPNIIDAFSAAAFRFGHSLLPTAVERWSKAHKFIASKRLSDLIRRPYDLYRAGVMDEYLMGLMNQVAQAMDDSITQEVTNHLLKKPGAKFGFDLVAFNMQRGREFGVPGYMAFRKFCGLESSDDFLSLFGTMPNTTVHRYMSIFQHTMDVDLWSGGVSEKPLPGSMIGPTFACIIATQMSFLRRGDRFWYELPNQPSSFTPEQLKEIKKTKLSRVICDNTDLIDTIQVYPMVLPDYEINPRVPCKSGILPSLDLTKWAEYEPTQDVTDANEGGEVNSGESEGSDESEVNDDESSLSDDDKKYLYTIAVFTKPKVLNITKVAPKNMTIKFPSDSFVVVTPRADIKNTEAKPLKVLGKGDSKILVTKGSVNKITDDKKVSSKIVFERRKREADYYDEYDSEEENPPKIENADDEYDSQYEYVKNDEKDAYDIHGYSDEPETTKWPPNQPAYSGKGHSRLNSGSPVLFNNMQKLYNDHRRHPGGAVSTSRFRMSHNSQPEDHHHHHYYDGLKETHYDPDGKTEQVYKTDDEGHLKVHQDGRHKHFHHVKHVPKKESSEMTSSEEEEYFNPEEMTTKELEDIYKTYDDSDVPQDIFPGDESKPKKYIKKISSAEKSKEEVDEIFKRVSSFFKETSVPR